MELAYVFLSTHDGDADLCVSAENPDAAYRKADLFVRSQRGGADRFSSWPEGYILEGGGADVHAIGAAHADVHVHDEPAWVM